MSSERNPVHLSTFQVGDGTFHHYLFPQERDQVELVDEKGETILEFSADLVVWDKNAMIGRITREGDTWVYYERPIQTRTAFEEMSLLKVEQMISTQYLSRPKGANHV